MNNKDLVNCNNKSLSKSEYSNNLKKKKKEFKKKLIEINAINKL